MSTQIMEGFELSPQQKRLWLLQKSEVAPYGSRAAILIEGGLDRQKLASTLQELVHRYEILRTRTREVSGLLFPLQAIEEPGPLSLPFHDLDGIEEGTQREIWLSLLREQEAEVASAEGPVLRSRLVGLAPERHLLLLALPAICADVATLDRMRIELSSLYRGEAWGNEEEPLQYADLAQWQNDLIQSEAARGAVYWRAFDPAEVAAGSLLFERRTATLAPPGLAMVATVAPTGFLEEVRGLAEREGVTVAAVLLAAWQTLLWRLGADERILVGVLFDGRAHADLQGALGPLSKLVPVAAELRAAESFGELARKTGSTLRQHRDWQDFFLSPQDESGQPRAFSFVFEHQPEAEEREGEPRFSLLDANSRVDRFKLGLVCSERQGGLRIEIQYDPALYPNTAALAMARQLEVLLASGVRTPGERLDEIRLLDDAMAHRLARELNATDADLAPAEPLLHALFELQARRLPGAAALEHEGATLSYGELDLLADRLAHHLQDLGISAEQRVAVCLEPSPEMVVALLAVLKAGGAYVPLDPGYPEERLELMIRDTAASVVITRKALERRLPRTDARAVLLEPGWEERLPETWGPVAGRPDPDGAAYVIFTSGSTGTPKGAMISHRAICNRLGWMIATFSFTAEDRFIQKTPFIFDASIWEFFVPLWLGAPLVLARAGGHQDPEYLLALMAERKVTILQMVPSLLQLLVQGNGLRSCPALRFVFSGGEPLSFETRSAVFEQTRARLVNLYGPTEAAIDATSWECDRGDAPGIIPIGRPIANDQVYVVEAGRELAVPGVAGELWLGGRGLGRGYLNRPDLTAERFVPDPFSGQPGVRLYRTGDLARMRADGAIEVIGRIDHQVKVRGLRIELGEIEAALARHPAVQQAVVIVREDNPGDRRLVAYVVAAPDDLSSVEELRGFLLQTLPEYMIPAAFVPLAELPRLPNGKIDRRELPAPEISRAALARPFVVPRTEPEQQLAGIWSAVLGVPEVGIEDNFFELGGDSILMLQIVARAREVGIHLTPRLLFQHQTISALVGQTGTSAPVRAIQEEVTGPVPLTPIQHDFFARDLVDPQRYNQSILLEIRRPLPPAACATLVGRLLEQHDALRLRFERAGSEWRQENAPSGGPIPFGVVDLSALPEEERKRAQERAADEVHSSLNLSAGPLLRTVLFLHDSGENGRLLLVIHHLAVDGVSWRILLEDLQRGWEALAAGHPVSFVPKTTSYKEWAERLVAYAPSLEEELEVWLTELRRATSTIPIDLPGGLESNTEASAETVSVILEAEETRDLLTRVPEVFRASLNEALLAALAEALGSWTGGRPVLVELEGHGREDLFPEVDLSRTVGWFTSLYPVVLEATPGAGATLRNVREKLARVPGRGIGFGILRHLSGSGAQDRLRAIPSPRIAFNYLGQMDQVLPEGAPFVPARESSGRGQSLRQIRRYLLEVNALVTEGRLVVSCSYSRHLHLRATVERVVERLLQALRKLLKETALGTPGQLIPADFPLATALHQTALDRLIATGPEIEDVYPLSPLQQGLLFDVLRAPGEGAYVQQLSCRLSGEIRLDLFAQAWQRMVDRHTIFRTGFAWEDLEVPLQVVRRTADLPWAVLDWSDSTVEEQTRRLERLQQEDRTQGFAVGRAPLMRVTLIRLGKHSYELLWTNHHLVLDGWSVPLFVSELVTIYDALCSGREPELSAAVPYRRYIEWLLRQDLRIAETYWRRALQGFNRPTPVGSRRGASVCGGHRQRTLEIPEALVGELKAIGQRRQVTMNLLIQGIWALFLSWLSDRQDLVFGIVVSGRPAALEGSGGMVGMFVNTLPVRVRVDPAKSFLDWAEQLQAEQADAREFEHAPMLAVRGWSEVPSGQPLFESTFAFNNYPTTDALRRDGSAFELQGVQWQEQTSYPLDFTVGLGRGLAIRIMYDSGRIDPADVEILAQGVERLARAIAEKTDVTVGELLENLENLGRTRAVKGDRAVIESPMFKKVKPKPVNPTTTEVVSRSYLDPEIRLPLVIQPAGADVDLASWAASQRSTVDAELVRHGAILFRGFQIDTPPVFERFAASVCSELFNENGEHPRESVSGNVYTPVFYPAEKQLLWHNENSFNHRWPSKILFACAHPAEKGGETPVVDSRQVFDHIAPEVRAPFVEKGMLYVRNYGEGVGLDWRTVFRTEDRAEVERKCREQRIDFEWKDGNRLKTLAYRPAVIPHPVTGEMSWFNQAQHWHVSCLDEATRESVRTLFAEGDEPRNCYFGDGTPIPDAAMDHILDVYRRLEVSFPWQQGDVMLVDNVLAAHGRNEFVGHRKLLVALGDMLSFDEVQ